MTGKITSILSYLWGGICTMFGAFSLDEWAILIGIVGSVATYLTHLFYTIRKDKREVKKHELETLHILQRLKSHSEKKSKE
ncbi:HP1 family phage holin [Orbaceae bacterium ESL0721]|nr:HP1 family phage holin [Orbaceae bacterium ESL0721]